MSRGVGKISQGGGKVGDLGANGLGHDGGRVRLYGGVSKLG